VEVGVGVDCDRDVSGMGSSGYPAVTLDVPVPMVVGGATRRLGRLEAEAWGKVSDSHCAAVALICRLLEDFDSWDVYAEILIEDAGNENVRIAYLGSDILSKSSQTVW